MNKSRCPHSQQAYSNTFTNPSLVGNQVLGFAALRFEDEDDGGVAVGVLDETQGVDGTDELGVGFALGSPGAPQEELSLLGDEGVMDDEEAVLVVVADATALLVVEEPHHRRGVFEQGRDVTPHIARHHGAFDVELISPEDVDVVTLVAWVGVVGHPIVLTKEMFVALGALPQIPTPPEISFDVVGKILDGILEALMRVAGEHIDKSVVLIVLDISPMQRDCLCQCPQIGGQLLELVARHIHSLPSLLLTSSRHLLPSYQPHPSQVPQ